ncbi:MAG: DUF624 domain-containing protein [Bacteroides sp.]|nr:DUF624 domain-containing protein [Bacteroides sp.]MCM1549013.1 DUF624 domain-containing protein [Clostridium sp.]
MSNYGTFGENNPVWKAINRFADMMVTGILFIITCIPVITIGASLCAFYYTAMDSLRKEDGYIFKRYFISFGKNFKKGTLIWLIMLAAGIIFGMDIYFWLAVSDMQFAVAMVIISAIIALAWLLTFVFVFPLQARFENTIKNTIKNAFLIGVSHLPFAVAVIIFLGILVYLCCLSWFAVIIMVLFGIGVSGYLLVYNFERFFKKCGYIDENDGKINNDDYDFNIEVDFDEIYDRKEEASLGASEGDMDDSEELS